MVKELKREPRTRGLWLLQAPILCLFLWGSFGAPCLNKDQHEVDFISAHKGSCPWVTQYGRDWGLGRAPGNSVPYPHTWS